MTAVAERPRPVLHQEYCKGCGRCIEACTPGCIEAGTAIHPLTGLLPVTLHLETCNGCGLCVEACPEPYGMVAGDAPRLAPGASPRPFGRPPREPAAADQPEERVALPETRPLMLKGAHAAAVGALLAGCRHVYGYPITPSTDGGELMARLLPGLGGTFVQAVSEVATVSMM